MNSERIRPINPEEIAELKLQLIPDAVIEVVNALLAKKAGQGSRIVLTQTEIVRDLVKRGFSKNELFEQHYMDFEPIYRNAGWDVVYDGPAYNESYEPTFTFSKSRARS